MALVAHEAWAADTYILTAYVADIPNKLRPDRLYVAGEDGYAWSAAMLYL